MSQLQFGPTDPVPDPHRPNLEPSEAAQLVSAALDTRDVKYGTPLTAVVEGEAPWMSWLEGALVAGYLPYFDTVPLLISGIHLWYRRQVATCIAEGVLGDAEGWLGISVEYRRVAEQLVTYAQEFERDLQQLSTEDPS